MVVVVVAVAVILYSRRFTFFVPFFECVFRSSKLTATFIKSHVLT